MSRLPEPADPVRDPNRYNPEPHWRIYDHPERGPVPVNVQDFDYRDYDVAGKFLGYTAYPDEKSAQAVIDAARPRGLDAYLTTLTAPEFRQVAIEAVAAELRLLRQEMQARAIRSGGRVDLTLDDLNARIAQVDQLS